MKYFAITDIGKKYDHNEDYYLLPEPDEKYGISKIDKLNRGELFILCDGMGGGNSGEVVSELTASWLMKDYYSISSEKLIIPDILQEIILNINERVIKLSSEHEMYEGMGSTLLALLFINEKAYIYSVGDSRIYLLRGNKLKQITEDQSEVWELYKKNIITREEMRRHPNKHILSNAIGNKNDFKVNYYVQEIEKDDLFLMCSDGLTDMLTDKEIEKTLNYKMSSLKMKGNKLVKDANLKGGRDNITAIMIKN